MPDDFHRRGDDLLETPADLIEQTRSARHRIPEQCIDLVAVDLTKNEDLQIAQRHVEHLSRSESKSFENAVRGDLVRTSEQRQRVGHDVGVKADWDYMARRDDRRSIGVHTPVSSSAPVPSTPTVAERPHRPHPPRS